LKNRIADVSPAGGVTAPGAAAATAPAASAAAIAPTPRPRHEVPAWIGSG